MSAEQFPPAHVYVSKKAMSMSTETPFQNCMQHALSARGATDLPCHQCGGCCASCPLKTGGGGGAGRPLS